MLDADYVRRDERQWLSLLVTLGQGHARRGMLVSGIERIIRAGDEYLAPFHQTGGKKARDRADDDFLEEGGVHLP